MDDMQPTGPGDQDHLPEQSPPIGQAAVAFLTLGVAWAALLAAGWGLGSLVDGWLGTGPAFTLVGLLCGTVLAVMLTVIRIRKYL